MKLKELKTMIAQQAVRSIIESKVSENTVPPTSIGGRLSGRVAMNTSPDPTIDQERESDVPNQSLVYHAKKRIASDAKNMSLTDEQRKGAAYLNTSFQVNAKLDAEKVSETEILDYLVDMLDLTHGANKLVKPYLTYLKSEYEENKYEKKDEDDSLRALSGDDLDLVNVDPETGEGTKVSTASQVLPSANTALGRKPRKLKETKRKTKQLNTKKIDETINNIKSVLKN